MDFDLTGDQTMLSESVARFLAKHYDAAARRRIVASPQGMSREIWRELAALGLLGATLPESANGLGAGPVERAVIMEAFGRALVVEPYVSAIVLAAEAVARLGDETQCAGLADVVAGERLLAFAHAEAGQPFDSQRQTRAQRPANGWEINGAKVFVTGAHAAESLVVTAAIGADGLGVFVVPIRTPGVAINDYLMIDGARAADVTFSAVRVNDEAWLGANSSAAPVLDLLLDTAIAASAAEAVGAIDAVIEATRDYARTREQFGQPIGKFQSLQHRMADMAVLREEARSLSLLATLSLGAPPPLRARAASAAKIKIGRAAKLVAEHAVQIHGAMGVTDELTIGAYLKRAIAFNASFGSVDEHLRRYRELMSKSGKSIVDDLDVAA